MKEHTSVRADRMHAATSGRICPPMTPWSLLIASSLLAAPTAAENVDPEVGAQGGSLGEGEEAQPIDPALATFLESLSEAAAARYDQMDDEALDALVSRHLDGQTLDPIDTELAEAVVESVIAQQDATFGYQTGDITLGSGLATLHLGESFRYLSAADARRVIVEYWENPPERAEGQLGMIVPARRSPIDPDGGWGVIITYAEDGHVDDEDAEDIDYDELLEQMQEATRAENEELQQRGYTPMELIGWAAPPHYDAATKRLYWAQELQVAGVPARTLNYAIRVLGRKGVLELNAIGMMSQMDDIQPQMESVLGTVEFEQGHRYEDFDPDLDEVAAYGIAGLVAGKLAAKAGIFAVILKFLLAAKKVLVVGLIAIGVLVKRLFARRSDTV